MSYWKADALVSVYQFTRQQEGNEVVIGHLDTSVFLVLPNDALEVLDWLATGKTVGEVQTLYQKKYGEIPDLEDLLELLAHKGFVAPVTSPPINHKTSAHFHTPKAVNYHFTNFPSSLARLLFGKRVLISCGLLIGMGLLGATIEPTIVPGWNAYFFPENFALMALILMLMDSGKVFLHELAHLLAARAVGVPARMGISHRLWILVAETDMTGIWSIPRQQRYLPLLAGVLLDAVSASLLVLCLLAEHHGLWSLPPLMLQLTQAMLLTYFLGLLWQCYFFVRTDFYYVLANWFGCKNLMQDTEVFLWNYVARFIPGERKIDRSHIRAKEMQVIRGYALMWLLGRAAAFTSLFCIGIPLCWHYSLAILSALSQGYQFNLHRVIDALLLAVMSIPQLIGFGLWLVNLRKRRR